MAASFELSIFALPFAVIVTKAVRPKHGALKFIAIPALALSLPYLVIFSGEVVLFNVYFGVTSLGQSNTPPATSVVTGYYIRCIASGDKVSVTGYATVNSLPFLALSPHDFHIRFISQLPYAELDLGRPNETTKDILLAPGKFTRIAFAATPLLKLGEKMPSGEFDCSLSLPYSGGDPPLQSQDIQFAN